MKEDDLLPTTFGYVKELHTEIRELREYKEYSDNFLVISEMNRAIKDHEDAIAVCAKYPNNSEEEIRTNLEAFYTVRKFYERLLK